MCIFHHLKWHYMQGHGFSRILKNLSLLFFSTHFRFSFNQNIRGLDSPPINSLERENLILIKKMLKKCSIDQNFIRKRNTIYKIGTLVGGLAHQEFRVSVKPIPKMPTAFTVCPPKFEYLATFLHMLLL